MISCILLCKYFLSDFTNLFLVNVALENQSIKHKYIIN